MIGRFSIIIMVARSFDIAASLGCIQLLASGTENRLKRRYLHPEVAVRQNWGRRNTAVFGLER